MNQQDRDFHFKNIAVGMSASALDQTHTQASKTSKRNHFRSIGRLGLVAGALAVVLSTASAQSALWEASSIPSDPTFTTYYTTVHGFPQGVDGSEVDLTLHQLWAQVGQTFPTAKNWGANNGVGFAITNTESFPISMGILITTSTGAKINTIFNVPANKRRTYFVDNSGFTPGQRGMDRPMSVLPGEYSHLLVGESHSMESIKSWNIYYRGSAKARVKITGMKGYGIDVSYPNTIDRYGQVSYLNWPGKTMQDSDLVQDRDAETAELAANPSINETWGSNGTSPANATGKWRTVKGPNGKWYFVTPYGKIFWSVGITSVVPGYAAIIDGRRQMFQEVPATGTPEAAFYGTVNQNGVEKATFDFSKANMLRKYGGATQWQQAWYDRAALRMKSWGINTLGNGCDMYLMDAYNIPATTHISTNDFPTRIASPLGYGRNMPDPFDPTFTTWMVTRYRPSIQYYGAQNRLLGVYVDCENPWMGAGGSDQARYGLPLAALRGPKAQPAKQIFVAQLRNKYSTIGALNTAWGTTFASWDYVYNNQIQMTGVFSTAAKADMSKFLSTYVAKYYSSVKNAITTMNLRCLFLGSLDTLALTPPEVHVEAVKYVDTVSITSYGTVEEINWTYLNGLKKPVLISEFAFASNDRGPSASTNWMGALQFPGAQRAIEARRYLDKALESPNIVGAHWYIYQDNIACGRATDTQNYPIGIVDMTDRPYPEMTNMFRSFTSGMYDERGFW